MPRIGSLCTGYGGLDMAVTDMFGGELAWASDIDPAACQIIAHRMPGVANIGDLTAANWAAVEPVDVVTGGYPCQPFSIAGKRKGTADERHLWPYIARALGVLRPRVAFFENVANHLRIGFDTVLADLAALGFDAEWCVVRADEVRAPHRRERLFVYATRRGAGASAAYPLRERPRRREGPGDLEGAAGADAGGAWLRDRHPAAAGAGHSAADANGHGREVVERSEPGMGPRRDAGGRSPQRWGRFSPAVARWEAITGRRAPGATDHRGRLSPAFVEWMMGLPAGWVTDVPGLSRAAMLRVLGAGAVPAQGAAACRILHARAVEAGS
ncbi:DNA cytosine methyltransferase [Streptomyces sp. WAC 06738]|uniref:DNA cytosine methyltransferase n=1 Tax=Streptomyces sp. WAC 06738 TaxID=2203210 RepID=UPI000F709770|nr:DNA cytosine methyltransferase [Streptomyces sp. WAC 06738]AZM50740.1 DNA cytosine methyltransferase [Streptomyces sp. WAC 06738]